MFCLLSQPLRASSMLIRTVNYNPTEKSDYEYCSIATVIVSWISNHPAFAIVRTHTRKYTRY